MTDEPPPSRAVTRVATAELVGRPPDGVTTKPLLALVARLLRKLGHADATVGIRFACDRTVKRFNREHRGVDRATDILSFPLGDEVEGKLFLGDLLISRERVSVQSRRGRVSPQRETEELLIHGVLHLIGNDHESDAGEMDALELRLRGALLDDARSVVR